MKTHYQSSRCRIFWVSQRTQQSSLVVQGLADELTFLTGPAASLEATQPSESKYGGWLASEHGESDVISCTWNKDTQNPAGVAQIQVKTEREYHKRMKPGDLLYIYMSYRGDVPPEDQYTLVTIVFVDRVEQMRQVNGEGATVFSISISARDFGKVLMETQVFFDPSMKFLEEGAFTANYWNRLVSTGRGAMVMSPVENVLNILDVFYNTNATENLVTDQQWRYPGTDLPLIRLLNVGALVQAPIYGYTYEHFMPLQQAGNVWSLMQSFANPCVNEMFVDVREITEQEITFRQYQEEQAEKIIPVADYLRQKSLRAQVQSAFQPDLQDVEGRRTSLALVFRQYPYDTEAFYNLPYTEIDETETHTLAFGRASHEVYNFIRVRFSSIPQYQEFNYGLLVNLFSLKSYGLKRLEVDTLYPFADSVAGISAQQTDTSNGSRIFDQALDYYTGVLATWNLCNEELYTGSWSGRFLPHIRAGTQVRIKFYDHGKKKRLDAYVQGVQHAFSSVQGQSRTSLTLVRGVVLDLTTQETTVPIERSMLWSGLPGEKVRQTWARLSPNGDLELDGQVVRSAQRGAR